MRTTLSLDDDVAALLKQTLAKSKKSLKQLVNEALRAGLKPVPPKRTRRTRTRTWNGGQCLIGSITSVSDALAIAEGESFR